ncbi:L-lactate dehydrogenase [Candidatus Nanosyncoccus alces]|uniref:L-lactate dehydrogenase n=1 Tax=Candidatus Nanosyncoccus alces TaxID=2171997 RepID=A0ABY0FPJ1_9BACT|nr:L-lactate dehydrogenase [Candidatus Nanosyncoccus alces]RYC75183.1 L-lactate dehydrogenase P [Candidatus Nanosyncoccus alces]
MDNNKVMIVGTGNVGASIAFAILNQRTTINEIVLTDIIAKDAEGEAMDLRDALAVAPSYVKVSSGTYKDAKDCDVVVITAGAAQKPGETRMELLKKNVNILKGMVEQIMASGFNGIFLVVTNPMDVMTYYTMRFSGLPAERVIGSGTVLDSARLRQRVANYLNINAKSVHAYQVGEHGDTELTLWSLADVGGQKVSELLPADVREGISGFVRDEAYEIINKKGATYYGIATCVVAILNCILNDEMRVMSVSSYDGFSGTCFGWPSVVGRAGVVRRLDLKIAEKEGVELQKSINVLKKAINSVKL